MRNIVLIGFAQATITNDVFNLISAAGHHVTVLDPELLLANQYPANTEFLITVTRDLELRKALINKLDELKLPKATFIHASAVIDKSSVIGKGTFVGPFVFTAFNSYISDDCIIGPYSMISHKTHIGPGCILHPNAAIAGTTKIGNYCLLGMRSTVLDNITICDNVTIGGGAMVTKDITEPGYYLGSPARKAIQNK